VPLTTVTGRVGPVGKPGVYPSAVAISPVLPLRIGPSEKTPLGPISTDQLPVYCVAVLLVAVPWLPLASWKMPSPLRCTVVLAASWRFSCLTKFRVANRLPAAATMLMFVAPLGRFWNFSPCPPPPTDSPDSPL
jgi:hypothetical protein